MIHIASTTAEEQLLIEEGKLLPVMEHFYTIQGEGMYTGVASYFIRLGGCDVGCHWCDVKDSWDAEKHPLTNVDELVDLATSQAKTIIITGGEPLMWDLTYLTKKLHEKGARIHIETSGAYPLSGEIDWVCLLIIMILNLRKNKQHELERIVHSFYKPNGANATKTFL